MAEIRIKVKTEELRAAITKFNTCKDEMAQAYSQMSTEVLALNSSWDGEANQAFTDRFSELINNIRTSDATIEQAVKGLETAATAYENAENENVGTGESMTEAPGFFG